MVSPCVNVTAPHIRKCTEVVIKHIKMFRCSLQVGIFSIRITKEQCRPMHYIYNIEPEAHCILVICDKDVEVIVQTENYVKVFDLSPKVRFQVH